MVNSTTEHHCRPSHPCSVYAPTMSATSDTKDELYENLAAIISSAPKNEQFVLLGDFNARLSADHDTWPSCLGQFGVGKMNEDGQRLLSNCALTMTCASPTPTFGRSPSTKRSTHTHTHSYYSADCNTDNSLVCCKIRLQPKRFYRTKKQGNPRIEVSKMSQPNLVSQ